jgi:hypothetical protein
LNIKGYLIKRRKPISKNSERPRVKVPELKLNRLSCSLISRKKEPSGNMKRAISTTKRMMLLKTLRDLRRRSNSSLEKMRSLKTI